jgi:hypothetical protein
MRKALTQIQTSKGPKEFGPTSVVPCHSFVGALAYVRQKRESKVKLVSVPKPTRAITGD